MLGTVCFWRNSSRYSAKVSISQVESCSFRAYAIQLTTRSYLASPNLSRCLSWPSYHDSCTTESSLHEIASIERCSSLGNLRAADESSTEANCATIWHGLLPSRHQSTPDQTSLSISKQGFDARALGFVPWNLWSLPYKEQGLRRLARASSLLDGSWNAAWDARPARWLHGKHSAWLLFGVCSHACFPGALSISVPRGLSKALEKTSEVIEEQRTSTKNNSVSLTGEVAKNLQKKQVYTNYKVIGIPSDGRCLFRAIAHGACIRNGEPAPNESLQQKLADDLRSKVVSELINRRSESEWFIEEDFDAYIQRMREPYVWGGEPELLMASHVLKMPITVLFFDQSSKGLISIVDYGSEYGSENPVRILYHGFGHYDAVQIF